MTMDNPNSNSSSNSFYYSMKFILVGIVSLVHFVSIATSFEVFSPFAPAGGKSSSRPQQLHQRHSLTQPQSQRVVCPFPLQQLRGASFFEQSPRDKDECPSVTIHHRKGAGAFAFQRANPYRPNHSHSKLWLSSSSPESPENADAALSSGKQQQTQTQTRRMQIPTLVTTICMNS